MSLKINDLLHMPQSDIDKVKIKFNQPSLDEDTLDLYRKNPDIINTQWLFWREQRHYFLRRPNCGLLFESRLR